MLFFACLVVLPIACAPAPHIDGLDTHSNKQLRDFLTRTADFTGRKVAVFDGDGTVLGQTPHYLADECLYEYAAQHPDYKADLIGRMRTQSNVSLPYVQNRVRYFAGLSLVDLRVMGSDCYGRLYPHKVFTPIRDLISILKQNDFEVWVVTASPEALYQEFLSRELSIPITNVVGVKSIVRDGITTDEIVHPVPQDEGKKEAIETFIQARPLLVAGNSRGDKEMIEFSADLHVIINPDEHVAPDQSVSIAEYARQSDWMIVRIPDTTAPDFPSISSKQYGVRLNKEHTGATP
ncbi:MAG: haloacid dehalogenase-like hydrolase [Leptospiraceae bacterium]|nr:haloacid dehalogenase-like hydrolase [Leptospiraceae bacterium]